VEYRRLGRSGLRVSEISLGSWLTFGSAVDDAAVRAIVHRAFDLGINLFDTADVYARGAAEESLGRAIRDLPRHHLVLATKCFFPMSEDPNDRGLSRKHLRESVEGSLRRLGTDYLDLHQCHRPDPATPLEETVDTYRDLVRQGKVLYWGVSLFEPHRIVAACRLAEARGGVRPVSNQPPYSILRRSIEAEVLPVCSEEGLSQIAFSPLAQGVLTGKYRGGRRPPGTRAADPVAGRFLEAYLEPGVLERVEQLLPLAAELGLTPAQLALSWCLRHADVATALVGATRPEQVEENARASGVQLPEEALARIDALFPPPGA